MTDAKQKSLVWKHFKVDDKNPMQAICSLCKMTVSRGGKGNLRSCSTTPLTEHLRRHHIKEFTNINEEQQKLKATASSVTSTKPQLCQQQTLSTCYDKAKPYDSDSSKVKELDRRVLMMVAMDLQPFSIVEDVGFRYLIQGLDSRYKLPSRDKLTRTILPAEYNKLKAVVSTAIAKAKHVSCTTDIWTAQHSNQAYVSLTATWITDQFKREKVLLAIRHLPGSHTAVAINEAINTILAEYSVDQATVKTIVHDNASSMMAAFRGSPIQSVSCFAHSLQLCIQPAVLSQRMVSDIVAICSRMITHFNHSALATSKLIEIQKQLDLPQHKLLQNVITRWNSTYYMLERVLEQKQALVMYSSDCTTFTVPSSVQWQLMSKVIALLAPMEELTRQVCLGNSCASIIIPAVSTLIRCYTKDSDDSGVQTMKNELKEQIESRFSQIENNEILSVATLLDPRFKDRYFQNGAAKEAAKATVMRLLQERQQLQLTQHGSSGSEINGPPDVKRCKSVWDCLDEEHGATSGQQQDGVVEFHMWLPLACEDRHSCDVLAYWEANKGKFPNVAALAQQYLATQATSVDSERLFSFAGSTVTERRNRLDPENVEQLMFIHHNAFALRSLD